MLREDIEKKNMNRKKKKKKPSKPGTNLLNSHLIKSWLRFNQEDQFPLNLMLKYVIEKKISI